MKSKINSITKNDIFYLPLRAVVLGYADDTSLLYSAAAIDEIKANFGHDQVVLSRWFRQNLLHLNLSKCRWVEYAYKSPEWRNSLQLSIENKVIEPTNEIKYLGLILDEKLTWRAHSIYLQSKLRKLNYLFYHLKQHINLKHLRKLYPLCMNRFLVTA